MKSIKEHIVLKPEISIVKMRIDADLKKKIKVKLKEEGLTLRQFAEACIKTYLGD